MKKIVGFTEKKTDISGKCLPIAALYVLYDGRSSLMDDREDLDTLSEEFERNLASRKNLLSFSPNFLRTRYNRKEIQTPYHFIPKNKGRSDYHAMFVNEIEILKKKGLLSDIYYKDDSYSVIVCARSKTAWDAHAFAVKRSGDRYCIYESYARELDSNGMPVYDYKELVFENDISFKKYFNLLFRSCRPFYTEMKLIALITPNA